MEVHAELQTVMTDSKSGYLSFSHAISIGNVIQLLRDSTIKS